VIPFVTEELWTALTGGTSIVTAAWPGERAEGVATQPARDPAAEAEIGSLMALVTEVRRFRSDQGLRPAQPVPAVLGGIGGTPLAAHEGAIRSLLRLTAPGDGFTPTASLDAEGVTVELDTAATIDVAAERRRMEKDLAAKRPARPNASSPTTPSWPRHPARWWTRPGAGWRPPGPTSPGSRAAWPH
jgi:valyl-tRNA synthetase